MALKRKTKTIKNKEELFSLIFSIDPGTRHRSAPGREEAGTGTFLILTGSGGEAIMISRNYNPRGREFYYRAESSYTDSTNLDFSFEFNELGEVRNTHISYDPFPLQLVTLVEA